MSWDRLSNKEQLKYCLAYRLSSLDNGKLKYTRDLEYVKRVVSLEEFNSLNENKININ